MNIANQGFPATRADLNNALQAIATNNSGTSAPSTTFANQWFYNTSSNKLFIRNEANSAFIEVATLDQTNNEWQITTGVIQAKDSDGLALKTDDGTTRLFIKDSDGKIGLGTASPNAALTVVEETSNTTTRSNQLILQANTSGTAGVGFGSNLRYVGERADGNIQEMGLLGFAASVNSSSDLSSDFVVETATSGVSSEKLRVTHNGTLGLGTDAPAATASTYKNLQIGLGSVITGRTDDTFLYLNSNLSFNSSNFNYIANTTASQVRLGTNIQFFNAPSGSAGAAATITERMRTNAHGQMLIGEYSWLGSGTKSGLQVKGGGGGPFVILCKNADSSGGASQIKFLDGGNDICGTIVSNATSNTTTYGTTSDYRLKENVTDVENAIDKLKSLSPKNYNFITDPDKNKEDGFLAHELASVIPSAVSGEKDGMIEEALYEDGDDIPDGKKVGDVKIEEAINPQQVDYGRLTPILTAALQEAIAKIEALETKVAALEG